MFNIGTGEIALIAVVALLILGPTRLPELARGIGKFMREFRRQTDEVRGVVEREFYKMDADLSINEPPLTVHPANGLVPKSSYPTHSDEGALPAPAPHLDSQLTAGMPRDPADCLPLPEGERVGVRAVEGPAVAAPEASPPVDPALKS